MKKIIDLEITNCRITFTVISYDDKKMQIFYVRNEKCTHTHAHTLNREEYRQKRNTSIHIYTHTHT